MTKAKGKGGGMQRVRIESIALGGLVAVAALAYGTVGNCAQGQGGDIALPALDDLVGRVRTEELRDLVREYYGRYCSRDLGEVASALDFFGDIREKRMIEFQIVHGHPQTGAQACRLYVELTKEGDVAAARVVREALSRARSVEDGGARSQILANAYRQALTETAKHVTGLQFEGLDPTRPDELYGIFQGVETWIAEQDR